jgi:hypothetical protein
MLPKLFQSQSEYKLEAINNKWSYIFCTLIEYTSKEVFSPMD